MGQQAAEKRGNRQQRNGATGNRETERQTAKKWAADGKETEKQAAKKRAADGRIRE